MPPYFRESREFATFATKTGTMPTFKIFRIITLILPLLALAYVMWRTWRIMPFPNGIRIATVSIMLLLFALMPICMHPGSIDRLPHELGVLFYKASLSWVFVLVYLFMAFLFVDLLGALHIVPHSFRTHSLAGTAAIAGTVAAVMLAGNLHYHHKHREMVDIRTDKPIAKPLKIVMISDIHLGYHIRRDEFAKWVDMINGEKPDIVLIAGDIIDRSVEPLLKEGVAQEFRRISAPVYACPGNHEYYAGIDKSLRFCKIAGITMLRDTAAAVAGINIIGRDDRTNTRRKPLEKLVAETDKGKFTILLDHQPYSLGEAQKLGIDFEFCGHTHHGQIWPVSWITDALYEDAYGPLEKGNTNYYVSSGIGIWGGKFRIGTRSEYLVAEIATAQPRRRK